MATATARSLGIRVSKLFRCERLRSVRQRLFRVWMHFQHDAICSSRHRSEGHGWDMPTNANTVAGIGNHG